MLDIYPAAAPVIVVSTGTGYNWNTFDFFTVQRGDVAPFIGGIGYDGKFPVQLRDSGGFGDYYHFICARRSSGAISLTQQQFGDPKGLHGPHDTPRTYVVTSYQYVARSGTKFSAQKLRTERVPTAQLSFAPSKLC
jgi:hypothetical protein